MRWKNLTPWLYLTPALLIVTMVAFFPIGYCIRMSFYTTVWENGVHSIPAGIENYNRITADQRLGNSLINTIIFTAISVPLEFVLGLIYALLLTRIFFARGFFRACALIPWALPPAIIAMSWRWIFNDTYGIFGDVVHRLGLAQAHVGWLGTPELAMGCIIAADVWKTTPFICIVLLAGLQSIPKDLYEAASLDGAGPLKRFFMITLPFVRPYIAIALLFRAIQAFGVFDIIWVLTEGGPAGSTETLTIYAYNTVFRYLDTGYGAALTILLAGCLAFIAGSILLLIYRRPIQA